MHNGRLGCEGEHEIGKSEHTPQSHEKLEYERSEVLGRNVDHDKLGLPPTFIAGSGVVAQNTTQTNHPFVRSGEVYVDLDLQVQNYCSIKFYNINNYLTPSQISYLPLLTLTE